MLTKITGEPSRDADIHPVHAPAKVCMPSIAQARLINLKLITSRRGSKTRLAEMTSLNPSVISHILKRRYAMSDEVAFRLESAFDLSAGFLDQVRSVIDFPESMHEFIQRDLSSFNGVMALISGQSPSKAPDSVFLPTVSEFEKLPSFKLTESMLGVPRKSSSFVNGPLLNAFCHMFSQRVDDGSISEETALKLIQVLMKEDH